VTRASHHDDVLARVWSLFIGMLGGAAIVGVLLVGHALLFDGGSNGIASTGTTTLPAPVSTAPEATTPPSGAVTLLDVFRENDRTIATVMVDADSYNVAPGDTFAANYRLDAIDGRCAQLRHGSNAFALCVGASTQT
jgi:hypothetical protein